MPRPIKRPGYPWNGQGLVSPQAADEIIRRLNQRQLIKPDPQVPRLRWFRPLSQEEFDDAVEAETLPTGSKNQVEFREIDRFSAGTVDFAYAPSMWCIWSEFDIEDIDQKSYNMDIQERIFQVYFPTLSWARGTSPAIASKNMATLKRVLMHKLDKGRFPALLNHRTGRWECISLSESVPKIIWAIPKEDIGPATEAAGETTATSGQAEIWTSKEWDPDLIYKKVDPADNEVTVYNWKTDLTLTAGAKYEFRLDESTGQYVVLNPASSSTASQSCVWISPDPGVGTLSATIGQTKINSLTVEDSSGSYGLTPVAGGWLQNNTGSPIKYMVSGAFFVVSMNPCENGSGTIGISTDAGVPLLTASWWLYGQDLPPGCTNPLNDRYSGAVSGIIEVAAGIKIGSYFQYAGGTGTGSTSFDWDATLLRL